MPKKGHKLKTSPLIKNPQFSSNFADIKAKLPTHKVVILTKFYEDFKKILGFCPFMHHPLLTLPLLDFQLLKKLLHMTFNVLEMTFTQFLLTNFEGKGENNDKKNDRKCVLHPSAALKSLMSLPLFHSWRITRQNNLYILIQIIANLIHSFDFFILQESFEV